MTDGRDDPNLPRKLLLFAVFIVAFNLSLKWAGQYTSFKNLRSVFTGQAANDSWRPMLPALAVANSGERALYSKVFFQDHIKYIDPPTAMLLPWAIQRLRPGITEAEMIQTLNRVGWVATWCFIALSIVMFTGFIRSVDRNNDRSSPPIVLGGHARLITIFAALVLALFFYPATLGMAIGQIVTISTLFFTVAFCAWLRGSKSIAGIALAIASLVKPTYLLFLIWAAFRRERRFFVSFACTFAVACFASILIFGFHSHVEYLSVLNYVGQRGEAFYANQSVNGLLNRLLQPAEFRTWFLDAYPPYNPFIHAASVLTAILVTALALLLPRPHVRGSTLDFAGMLLAVLLASPITWEHSYGPLFPIYGFLLYQTLINRRLLAFSYILVANALAALVNVTNPPWNIVQSYFLFGAFLCAGLIYNQLLRKGIGSRISSETNSKLTFEHQSL
jgi:hypothetical protein